jgi:signal transduction histidine kinase
MSGRTSTGWWVTAVVVAGVAGTLLIGAFLGMGAADLRGIGGLILTAGVLTAAAALVAQRLLRGASLRLRFVALPIVAVAVTGANLVLLYTRMAVSHHDTVVVVTLLCYSLAAGLAVAIVLARRSSTAVGQLEETAEAIGHGDLEARVGRLNAGAELDALASTLDDMATRLAEAQARERAAESTRRDLIAAVSHDLRTPLASLRAMVEALDEGVVSDPASVERYVREMRRSTTQLSVLVDDLFEFAQLDAGAIAAETRRVRLDDVVASAVAAVEPSAREKGLHLSMDLGDAADAVCSPRLARVLQNLLVNAVRHTPADGAVSIQATRNEDRLALAVEDTGEGIAPEDLERVFEPFFRADPSRSGAGAGLGLALAKRIVETLGGRISAEPADPGGARFALEVPLV